MLPLAGTRWHTEAEPEARAAPPVSATGLRLFAREEQMRALRGVRGGQPRLEGRERVVDAGAVAAQVVQRVPARAACRVTLSSAARSSEGHAPSTPPAATTPGAVGNPLSFGLPLPHVVLPPTTSTLTQHECCLLYTSPSPRDRG